MSVCLTLHIDASVCLCVYVCSMAVHPDRVTIATGQVAGHDKLEGKVCEALSAGRPVLVIYI